MTEDWTTLLTEEEIAALKYTETVAENSKYDDRVNQVEVRHVCQEALAALRSLAACRALLRDDAWPILKTITSDKPGYIAAVKIRDYLREPGEIE